MGVSLRVIDKREAPATTSRAIGVEARTLEFFERRGLADEMVPLGNGGWCWTPAMVMKGEAPLSLLDTYEADRLPVMRGVLFRTDNLTNVIGTENPVLCTLFNHLAHFVGGVLDPAAVQILFAHPQPPSWPGARRTGQRT